MEFIIKMKIRRRKGGKEERRKGGKEERRKGGKEERRTRKEQMIWDQKQRGDR